MKGQPKMQSFEIINKNIVIFDRQYGSKVMVYSFNSKEVPEIYTFENDMEEIEQIFKNEGVYEKLEELK